MPIEQIWKNKRVSSTYILESVEYNMCGRQNKNRDAYDKICTKQREVCWLGSTGQTGQVQQHTRLGGTGQTGAPGRSDRSGPVSAQSNGCACYLVQGDEARVASWFRSLCSI
jgi:hypothetical protein